MARLGSAEICLIVLLSLFFQIFAPVTAFLDKLGIGNIGTSLSQVQGGTTIATIVLQKIVEAIMKLVDVLSDSFSAAILSALEAIFNAFGLTVAQLVTTLQGIAGQMGIEGLLSQFT
ncbi:uncharacterized protein LOC132260256 isoform X2 [Phlebotomus argentipes]|uniref:uncharacterized protein LOC132260256 isoform X2 n=1 Tax=Phlebotomus argentipes TaxID=94469 RepID=UPI0028938185|nr:uncharacterized protein LOC132260256 isoform X2 [Phlebotomus argentipes]